MPPSPSLLVFGPVEPWPGQESIVKLRKQLAGNKIYKPLLDAVTGLSLTWHRLVDDDPSLEVVQGQRAVEDLLQIVCGGNVLDDTPEKRNIINTPLTVITQITQYLHFVNQRKDGLDHSSLLERLSAGGGVQGFCAGLLSALPVANAKTAEDVAILATVSVQLAYCIGAYVDLDQAKKSSSMQHSTLAARWKENTTFGDIEQMLTAFPDAYIAVVKDVRDVTITVRRSDVEALKRVLFSMDVTAREVELGGRYHSHIHAEVPYAILKACKSQLLSQPIKQDIVRSNIDGLLLPHEDAYLHVLRSILVGRADWSSVMSKTFSSISDASPEGALAISFGADTIPHSYSKACHVIKIKTFGQEQSLPCDLQPTRMPKSLAYSEDAIAVIGMSCNLPGAETIDQFWSLLYEGKSMLSKMPKDRFDVDEVTRAPRGLKFWGNFLQNADAFDHKFFRKSPREAASTDPQQRLLLQAAYQAMESSGYFSDPLKPEDVGCYIGACATDYDGNVNCHPPTAYSTIGTLRAFLSGKISHYFGWSGPSLTFDTACSSSAVAIHTACTALQRNECSQALAGGVAVFTTPYLYENLTTAHFLSPTGATKPFDTNADGYCRGEGIGLVVLKKLTRALHDKDDILGVIAGSALNQNSNCVPITVPHSTSQGILYRRVAKQAGVMPQDVTFVEAHGTGTPMGDPVEMESIRSIFGGAERSHPLFVSSVKGNIGHLEGASGVAGLIKAILQMKYRTACTQASFKTLNPKIMPLERDKLCIPTSSMPLPDGFLTACINNYGAAGSNAAIMLLQAPTRSISARTKTSLTRHPVRITASSEGSLVRFCKLIAKTITNSLILGSFSKVDVVKNLAFNLARTQNGALAQHVALVATSGEDLAEKLTSSRLPELIQARPQAPPLVLCFGGQVSQSIGLNKQLWQECSLLRSHLDDCDNILQAMGYPGIYPAIFQTDMITDVAVLQPAMFALQYSSAKAWIDSGLRVDRVIGHSLGQFAALCISGALSLKDTLNFIAIRASLMKTHWGSESGSMTAVEMDRTSWLRLTEKIAAVNPDTQYEIACFNGLSAQVVVSDKKSADVLISELKKQSIRHKQLSVTHGFHSRFTDGLIPHLEATASEFNFSQPVIPIETCTDGCSWAKPSAKLLAAHTRDPVFFSQAVQRVNSDLGPCTFLEAGSASSIVAMTRKALGKSANGSHFVSMDLTRSNILDDLSSTNIELWRKGYDFRSWVHHRSQSADYEFMQLPPYQFELTKHWLDLSFDVMKEENEERVNKKRVKEKERYKKEENEKNLETRYKVSEPSTLLYHKDSNSQGHHFGINPRSDEFRELYHGYKLLGRSQISASLCIELATRALNISEPDDRSDAISLRSLQLSTLPVINENDQLDLKLEPAENAWKFQLLYKVASGNFVNSALGTISRSRMDSDLADEFAHYERLTDGGQFSAIEQDEQGTLVKGQMIHKIYEQVGTYADFYQNLKSVASAGGRIAARVSAALSIPPALAGSTMRPYEFEAFFQVAHFHANCVETSFKEGPFHISGFDIMHIASEHWDTNKTNPKAEWKVLVYGLKSSNHPCCDIFVYNADATKLAVTIRGARLSPLRSTPTHIVKLSAVATGKTYSMPEGTQAPNQSTKTEVLGALKEAAVEPKPSIEVNTEPAQTSSTAAKAFVYDDFCAIMDRIADVPRSEVKGDASFEDMGVDSLMMIEIIGEISQFYKRELPVQQLETLTDVNSLVNYLCSLGVKSDVANSEDCDSSGTSTPSIISTVITPLDAYEEQVLELTRHLDGDAHDRSKPVDLRSAQKIFDSARLELGLYNQQTGFSGFWDQVYPDQARLVEAYVLEAYCELGCDLRSLQKGERFPFVDVLPKHNHLMDRMRKILVDGNLFEIRTDKSLIKTSKSFDSTLAAVQYERMLQKYPLFSAETKLLHASGSQLAQCLTGNADPLQILFANKMNRDTMADVYSNAPMCKAMTNLLSDFLARTFEASNSPSRPFRILEIGAGTGGTARHLVSSLQSKGIKFEYTFSDISSALVTQARRSFSDHSCMKFRTLDCGQVPGAELCGQFDVVVATNVVHATPNATTSLTNISALLQENGIFCLVEFTNGMYWFDLVYGLLEGWWLFSDGRTHALADQWFWDSCLRSAGFGHVSWTDGATRETQSIRLICGFKQSAAEPSFTSTRPSVVKKAGLPMQTLKWKTIGNLDLKADVYFPKIPDCLGKRRPVALMIHGGGHLLFGRADIPMKHVRELLTRGYLPVSVDYRLCPEMALFDGPVTDCCDALEWVRNVLPHMQLSGPLVQIDTSKVLALGWSSGGQLAMTLGYTARMRKTKPPEVILSFYSPSDLEAEFWNKPNFPAASEEPPQPTWGELDCVRDTPIVEYTPMNDKRTTGLSLTLKDDRARLILHMNWTGQSVPVLVQGLPSKKRIAVDDATDYVNPPPPPVDKVRQCSPLWHIQQGTYTTPTFMVHGNIDDWIPYQMTQRTVALLKERGVPCGIMIPDQCGHAFDLFPKEDRLGHGWTAIEAAYDFAADYLKMHV